MDDHRAAPCGSDHFVAIERIAFEPGIGGILATGLVDIPGQRTHLPARRAQLSRHFAADTAGCTQYQYLAHHPLHVGWSGHSVRSMAIEELPKTIQTLYIYA